MAAQFKMSDTKPAPFMLPRIETVTVPMMQSERRLLKMAYNDDQSIALLELPYSGTTSP